MKNRSKENFVFAFNCMDAGSIALCECEVATLFCSEFDLQRKIPAFLNYYTRLTRNIDTASVFGVNIQMLYVLW